MFARYTYAVEAVRALVTFWSGESDEAPVDPKAIGASIIYDSCYRRYDRWRVRVTRLNPKVIQANREYDVARNKTKTRKDYKRDYMREYRRRHAGQGGHGGGS